MIGSLLWKILIALIATGLITTMVTSKEKKCKEIKIPKHGMPSDGKLTSEDSTAYSRSYYSGQTFKHINERKKEQLYQENWEILLENHVIYVKRGEKVLKFNTYAERSTEYEHWYKASECSSGIWFIHWTYCENEIIFSGSRGTYTYLANQKIDCTVHK